MGKFLKRNRMRRFFHWKHWVGTVITLWIAGVSVALASYAPQIPKQAFYFAYVLLAAAFLWSLGAFLTSNFLADKKHKRARTNKRRSAKVKTPTRFYSWMVSLSLPIVVLFLICLWLTWSIQTQRELSEMGGVLFAANDPDPPVPASCMNTIPSNALVIYYGNSVAFTSDIKTSVIWLRKQVFGQEVHKELLGIERAQDGSLAVNADLRSSDGKMVISISRNRFDVNENNVIKSLFRRPDKNTIRLTDQYGNKFDLRYLNRHALRISGKFFLSPAVAIDIREDGSVILPGNTSFRGGCSGASGAVFDFPGDF
jgi:hypothetical protein